MYFKHLVMVSLAFPLSAAAVGGNVFCCADESGKQACGDLVPSVCVGRTYREINPRGIVVRVVEGPLTPEMRALREQEAKKKKEAEDAAREQRRLDSALLQTYSSEADIETLRDRKDSAALKAIDSANESLGTAKTQRQKYLTEAEFYKNRRVPPDLERALKDSEFEIRSQEEFIVAKKRELEQNKIKFDEDLRRFRDIKTRARSQ